MLYLPNEEENELHGEKMEMEMGMEIGIEIGMEVSMCLDDYAIALTWNFNLNRKSKPLHYMFSLYNVTLHTNSIISECQPYLKR